MTFRVETAATAEQDADAILDWLLSEHAGDTGMRWFLALQDAIAPLAEFPERCPLAPESAAFPFEVRHLLYDRTPHVYRILFTIENQTVYVCISATAAANRWSADRELLLQQLPGDHQPLNLAGALANRTQLHVAIILLGGIIFDESISPVNLDAFVSAPHGYFAGIELRHG